MTDINAAANAIASNYVDFLLSTQASDHLSERMGGRELPSSLQDMLVIDELSANHYKTTQQEVTSSADPLVQFAERLKIEFSKRFEEVLKGETSRPRSSGWLPVENSTLTCAAFLVDGFTARDIIEKCDAEREATGLSYMSLIIKADSVPSYKVISNGAIVRYLMGTYELLPDTVPQGDLVVLTESQLSKVESQEILHAFSKVLELPVSVGETVSVFGNPHVVTESEGKNGEVYHVVRSAKGALFDPGIVKHRLEEGDYAHVAAPAANDPLIRADNGAYYRTEPAKLVFANTPTLVLGLGAFVVNKDQYIVMAGYNGPQILRSESALFVHEKGDYKGIKPSDIAASLVTTEELNATALKTVSRTPQTQRFPQP